MGAPCWNGGENADIESITTFSEWKSRPTQAAPDLAIARENRGVESQGWFWLAVVPRQRRQAGEPFR